MSRATSAWPCVGDQLSDSAAVYGRGPRLLGTVGTWDCGWFVMALTRPRCAGGWLGRAEWAEPAGGLSWDADAVFRPGGLGLHPADPGGGAVDGCPASWTGRRA